MVNAYSVAELILYLLLYSLLGWAIEVTGHALRRRRLVNPGLLSLPLSLRCGVTAVILMVVLPTLEHKLLLQALMCLIVWLVVRSLNKQVIRSANRNRADRRVLDGSLPIWQDMLASAAVACVYLTGYLLVHPLIRTLCLLIPQALVHIIASCGLLLICADLICVVYSLRTRRELPALRENRSRTARFADRIRGSIETRLERAYPGILSAGREEEAPVFARGLCVDKLIWVFLVSSFLGALIEMVYCSATGGGWMNRSSVLYGPFSFVWGFGAVVLTVTLQRIAHRNDRYVFLAGFLIGGAYEYVCSVFTELVFGTVFWDYSAMPLNIGGRTNVMYCFFWGLLAVVWVKVLYPPMSAAIERIPPLPGKILTWALVLVMACNGVLTGAAMIRYTGRQRGAENENAVTRFLDARYDDAWMQARWPNMVLADRPENAQPGE